MSNVAIYLIGALLVAGGLGYAVSRFAGTTWALVVAAVVLGFGVMGAVKSGRAKEQSPEDG